MNHLQCTKLVSVTPPAAQVNNASAVTAEIDRLGYDYLQLVVYLGATDIALTALAVTESDTAGSGHANITGAVFGTSVNSAGSTSSLPSATDDNKFFVVDVDLRGRKRYIDVTITVGAGTAGAYLAAFAILCKAELSPITAAGRGAGQLLQVPAFG